MTLGVSHIDRRVQDHGKAAHDIGGEEGCSATEADARRGVQDRDPGAPELTELAETGIRVAVIAILDWKVNPNVSLGFLYVFPILVIALFATRRQIVAVATACGVLREILSPLSWDGDAAARLLMGLIAFLGAGLFVSELARNHKLAVEHAGQLKRQIDLREEVQEDLRVLVESSPAAIFTLDAGGRILLANEAAQRLLGFEEHPTDESIAPFLPALLSALERPPLLLRTNMECIGRRRTGGLTERERTVLRGVFDGLANKEIAARLGISESAVKGLLQQMFHKTGVRTRSQLVRVALERYSQDL